MWRDCFTNLENYAIDFFLIKVFRILFLLADKIVY